MRFRAHRLLSTAALVIWFTAAYGIAHAATFSPATPADLPAARKAAVAGDTILLPAGTYATLDLTNAVYAAPGLTLKAAPGAAVVIGQATFNGTQGVSLAGVEIVQPVGSWMSALYVDTAARVNFDGLHVHHLGTAMAGTGVIIRSSTDVTFTNSEVDHVGLGIALVDSQRVTVRGNRTHDLSGDAIDVAGTSASIIDGNSDTDHFPNPGDHPDFIQFWGDAANPLPAGNVVTNNVYRRGKGAVVQGIFVERQANLTITGNGMSGAMSNGVSLSAVQGAVVTGNFVQGWTDMDSWITVRGQSSNVTVTGNVGGVSNVADGGLPNPNFVQSGNGAIPKAAIGDTSALDAWLAAKNGPTCPPDPQVSVLQAKVAALQVQLTAATASAAALQAQVTVLTATVASNAAAFSTIRAALPH